MPILLTMLLFLASQAAIAGDTAEPAEAVSAARAENEPWQNAALRHLGNGLHPDSPHSAYALAQPYDGRNDFSALPQWPGDASSLAAHYALARDERVYGDKKNPRRATWLYPDDGCYTRASHMARLIGSTGRPKPGKIFVLGDLLVRTPFTRSGRMSWWYHVAAAYRKGSAVVVLDPSVDPRKPLLLADWLARLTNAPQTVRIIGCDSRAYFPISQCVGGAASQERSAVTHLLELLKPEWQRALDLGFDPKMALGPQPPWAN